jgi:acetyl-CoA carboxylase biotin carboxyl carrier protein
MKIDKKLIKELTDYLNEFNLTELEYGDNDTKIKVSKSNPVSSHVILEDKNLTSASKKNQTSSEKKITSPIIGTAYLSPEPGAEKFIDLGKKIKKGDTIMIIEAMKTMNHVPSTIDGIVKEICVNDGSPVEFGQTVVILE